MTACLIAAAAGFASWSFVEYLVHGILSHRYKTFVSPLHWTHHRDPRAVFTSPAGWVPAALFVWGLLFWPLGAGLASCAVAGLVAGFWRYEYVHWRFHFREPRSARERLLRAHHLAHHYRNARAYHGVTTRFWDRVFGTLPARWREDYARVEGRPPMEGASNLRSLFSPTAWVGNLQRAQRPQHSGRPGASR